VGIGAIIAIIGIVVMIWGSFWLGLVILVIGLLLGGFRRGRWY
jgi:hypothetical protein